MRRVSIVGVDGATQPKMIAEGDRSTIDSIVITVSPAGAVHEVASAMRRHLEDGLCEGQEHTLRASVARTDSAANDAPRRRLPAGASVIERHAVARWARTVVSIVDSPRDPRTLAEWADWAAASAGAIRNWCHTAGIQPRQSLLFGRLLRAVAINNDGIYQLADLIDVSDLRTLRRLLVTAGFQKETQLPSDVEQFLAHQTLIPPAAVHQIRAALAQLGGGGAERDKAAQLTPPLGA